MAAPVANTVAAKATAATRVHARQTMGPVHDDLGTSGAERGGRLGTQIAPFRVAVDPRAVEHKLTTDINLWGCAGVLLVRLAGCGQRPLPGVPDTCTRHEHGAAHSLHDVVRLHVKVGSQAVHGRTL